MQRKTARENFGIADKERSERTKTVEDANVQTLLDEDDTQTQ